jgi:hypothetical protein
VRVGAASVVSAVALTAAGAVSVTESTIVRGVGIGKIKVGMTRAQVRRLLGRRVRVPPGDLRRLLSEFALLGRVAATWKTVTATGTIKPPRV